ncbi:MAG: hypothetical protein AB7F59_08965 [Bdellovibrionales bacterium]
MKNILFAALFISFAASLSEAQTMRRTNVRAYSSESQHAVSGALGFYSPGNTTWSGTANGTGSIVTPTVSGMFGIGGDYEYIWKPDVTFGGIFRYYSTSDSSNSSGTNIEETVKLWTLGGMMKAYAHTESWTGYLGTGIGAISPSLKRVTGTTTVDTEVSMGFGLYMAMGLLYKFNDQMAFGVENLRAMGLGEKINGWPINDFMFKGRFTL